MSRNRHNHFASSSAASRRQIDVEESPLFYSFMSKRNAQKQTSAIVDSGAYASIVRKATLDAALRVLNIAELKYEPVLQAKHRFGPSDAVLKTVCAIVMPAMCTTQNDVMVQLHVRFDVIEGPLPLLIGLSTLKAMDGILSLEHSNLSVLISKMFFRIQLVNSNPHLCLPLR